VEATDIDSAGTDCACRIDEAPRLEGPPGELSRLLMLRLSSRQNGCGRKAGVSLGDHHDHGERHESSRDIAERRPALAVADGRRSLIWDRLP
jgi:hypothetical protein